MNRKRLTPVELAEATKHIQPLTPEEKAEFQRRNVEWNEKFLTHKFYFADGTEIPRGKPEKLPKGATKVFAYIPMRKPDGQDS